jgi:CHAT domain-containing protein
MVLGDGIFLTAAEIQKLSAIPELVFLNCCHFGRLDRRLIVDAPHKLAASIAGELIKLGVIGIVAAGWAVDDAAATTFAAEFYSEMLSGETFGTAVHTARQRTYEQHGMTNTWGAYQCYGNPDFKLEKQAEFPEEESFSGRIPFPTSKHNRRRQESRTG